jgi:hypothetical protein
MEENEKDDSNIFCLKLPISKCLLDDDNNSISLKLEDAVIRTSKIVYHARILLRFFLLEYQHELPNLCLNDSKFISKFFNSVTVRSSAGRKPRYDEEIDSKITNIKLKYYSLTNEEIISKTNLTRILANEVNRLLTEIGNHVKFRYLQFLKTFMFKMLKFSLKFQNADENIQQTLKNEMITIMENLIKNKKLEDFKNSSLHEIFGDIQEYIPLIYTLKKEKIKKNDKNDIQCKQEEIKILSDKPLSYHICDPSYWGTFLKSMIDMNKLLENNNIKKFQFFPISKGMMSVKHIDIDPAIFHEVVMKSGYDKEIAKAQFLTSFKIPKYKKDFIFNDRISTDNYSISFQYRPLKGYEEKQEKSKIKYEARKKIIEDKKNMTSKEKEQYDELRKQKKEKLQKEKVKQRKEEINNEELKKEKEEAMKIEKEKQYVTGIANREEFIKRTKETPKLFIDPGKRDLLHIIDEHFEPSKRLKKNIKNKNIEDFEKVNQRMTYSFKQRKHDLKTRELNSELEKLKIKLKIDESSLVNSDSKSCNPDICKKYFKIKNELFQKYNQEYQHLQFRKIKFYRKINEIRADDLFVERIKKTFSKKEGKKITLPIIFLGDYSEDNVNKIKNFESTKGIGIRRRLQKNFETYLVDEFRTSKLSYKTEEECSKLVCNDSKFLKIVNERRKERYENYCKKENFIKNLKSRKNNYKFEELTSITLRSVLTYKLEKEGRDLMMTINRDLNACLNIRKIVFSHLKDGIRPLKYQRSIKS